MYLEELQRHCAERRAATTLGIQPTGTTSLMTRERLFEGVKASTSPDRLPFSLAKSKTRTPVKIPRCVDRYSIDRFQFIL
jgi:hypothetical protein